MLAEPQHRWVVDRPALLRRCREALLMSQAELAAALYLRGGGRTVRLWEAGDRGVPGPAWVALRFMLRERGEPGLAAAIDHQITVREAT